MADDPIELIVSEYIAAKPNRRSSRATVKEIASKYGMTEAKARAILVKRGVYLSMPKDKSVVEMADRRALVDFFAAPGLDYTAIKQAADQFGYTQDAISKFRATQGLPALSEHEQWSRDSDARLAAESEARAAKFAADQQRNWDKLDRSNKRAEAKMRDEVRQINRENGFFSHPLWPIQLMTLIFLVALVFTGIKMAITEG